MAANIIVPTKKQWQILSPILAELGEGGVIVAPDVVEELNNEGIKLEGYDPDYDFGGDSDIWLDVVYDTDHHFIQKLN